MPNSPMAQKGLGVALGSFLACEVDVFATHATLRDGLSREGYAPAVSLDDPQYDHRGVPTCLAAALLQPLARLLGTFDGLRIVWERAPSCGFEPQTTRLTVGGSTGLSYDGPRGHTSEGLK